MVSIYIALVSTHTYSKAFYNPFRLLTFPYVPDLYCPVLKPPEAIHLIIHMVIKDISIYAIPSPPPPQIPTPHVLRWHLGLRS